MLRAAKLNLILFFRSLRSQKKTTTHTHTGRRWQFTEKHTEGQNLQNKTENTANVQTGRAGV